MVLDVSVTRRNRSANIVIARISGLMNLATQLREISELSPGKKHPNDRIKHAGNGPGKSPPYLRLKNSKSVKVFSSTVPEKPKSWKKMKNLFGSVPWANRYNLKLLVELF